jgi:hypothetical protein
MILIIFFVGRYFDSKPLKEVEKSILETEDYQYVIDFEITTLSAMDLMIKANYKSKNKRDYIGGIHIFKFKNNAIFFDSGEPPKKKFSSSYQSGPLSFEYYLDGKKIITIANLPYYSEHVKIVNHSDCKDG